MKAECAICFEVVNEVGEIDGCCHVFCVPCIRKWAETETSCPLCKVSFASIRRKRLAEDQSPDRGNPHKRLKGTLLEEETVEQRKQKYQPEGLNVDLDELRCQICGSGEDPESLLLCDSCDRAAHTYCVGLQRVPTGRWDCPTCEQQRQARASRRRTAATNNSRAVGRRAGAGSTRGGGARAEASAAGARSQSRGPRRTRTGRGMMQESDSSSGLVDSENEEEEEEEGEGGDSGDSSVEEVTVEAGGRRRRGSRATQGSGVQRRGARWSGGAQRAAPRSSRAQGRGRRGAAVVDSVDDDEEEEYVDSQGGSSSEVGEQGSDDEGEWQEDWESSDDGQREGGVAATRTALRGGPQARRVTRQAAGSGSSRSSRRGGSQAEAGGRSTAVAARGSREQQGRGARGTSNRWTRRLQRITQDEATQAAAARIGQAGRQAAREGGASARQPSPELNIQNGSALARESAASLTTPSAPVDLTLSGHRTATRTLARARDFQRIQRHGELQRVQEMAHRWHAMRQEGGPPPRHAPDDLLLNDTPGGEPTGQRGQSHPSRPGISRRRQHVLDDDEDGSSSEDEAPLAQRLDRLHSSRGASSSNGAGAQAGGGPSRSGSANQGCPGGEGAHSSGAVPFLQRVQQRRGASAAQAAGSSDAGLFNGPSSSLAPAAGANDQESDAKQRLRLHVQGLQARGQGNGLAKGVEEERLWREAEEARQQAECRQAQRQQRQQQQQQQRQQRQEQHQGQQRQRHEQPQRAPRSMTPPSLSHRRRAGPSREEEHKRQRGPGAVVKRERVSPSKYAPATTELKLEPTPPPHQQHQPFAARHASPAATAAPQVRTHLTQGSRAPQRPPHSASEGPAIKAEHSREPAPGHAHAGAGRATAPLHTTPSAPSAFAPLQPPLAAAASLPQHMPRPWQPGATQHSTHLPFTPPPPPHPAPMPPFMPHCSTAPYLAHTTPPAATAWPAQPPWHWAPQPATMSHAVPPQFPSYPHPHPPASQHPSCPPAFPPATPPWHKAVATPLSHNTSHNSTIPATPSPNAVGMHSSGFVSPTDESVSNSVGPRVEGAGVQQQQQQQQQVNAWLREQELVEAALKSVHQQQQQQQQQQQLPQQQGLGESSDDRRARWERKEIKKRGVTEHVKDALRPMYKREELSKEDLRQITVDASEALAVEVQKGSIDERDTERMKCCARELVRGCLECRGLS